MSGRGKGCGRREKHQGKPSFINQPRKGQEKGGKKLFQNGCTTLDQLSKHQTMKP